MLGKNSANRSTPSLKHAAFHSARLSWGERKSTLCLVNLLGVETLCEICVTPTCKAKVFTPLEQAEIHSRVLFGLDLFTILF